MANLYKEKIANGANLTEQQIANMNHIVVNNYTNAGLSILFGGGVRYYLLRFHHG